MRWVVVTSLAFGLLLAPAGRADPAPTAGVAGAKYLDGSLDSDALSQARERALQICLQGAGPVDLHPQTSPRFLTFDAPKGSAAGVVYAWAVPDARSREHRALLLAAKILTGDPAAGLSQELIAKRRLATLATAGLLGQSAPDLFLLQISGAQTVHLEEIESLVSASLERLGAEGPNASELERAKVSLETEIAEKVNAELDVSDFTRAYRAVSEAEVQSAVLAYLTPSRRTTVEIRPRGSPEPWVPKPTDIVRPPFRLHTMKKGETLTTVAKRLGVSEKTVAKANGLDRKVSPYVGQTLKIPQQEASPAAPKRDAGSKAAKRPLARKKR
jgi:LysM repeat protein